MQEPFVEKKAKFLEGLKTKGIFHINPDKALEFSSKINAKNLS